MNLFELKALARVILDGNLFKKQETANGYANAINTALAYIEELEKEIIKSKENK